MMHADLIDEVDLVNQLRSLGFEVSGSAEQACKSAVCGLSETGAQALKQMVEKLYTGNATLLPAVRQAIDQQLLPGLVRFSPRPRRAVTAARWQTSIHCAPGSTPTAAPPAG